MIFLKYISIFFFLTNSLLANLNNEFVIGITIYENNDEISKRKIRRVALDVFKEIENPKYKKVKLLFFENKENVINDFKAFEKINMLVAYPNFYLENKDVLKKYSKEPFFFTRKNRKKIKMLLIANRNSNIKSLKDIKNKSYVSYINSSQGNIWLDVKTRRLFNKGYDEIIKKKKVLRKNSRMILDVFFQKADFTVVSKNVYEDMLYLNPSMRNELVVIEESKPLFFNMIGLFHKKTKNDLIERYNRFLIKESDNERLNEFYSMVNIYNMHKSTFEEFNELEEFYDEYKSLLK